MNYKIIYLLLIFSLSACSNLPFLNNSSCQSEYHEDFEEEIIFKHPITLEDGSFKKYGENDWVCYMEKSYANYDCSNTWKWRMINDSNSGSHGIRGTTSLRELGTLWLFKKYRVTPNSKISVSVYGRTKRIHSGTSTGPALYVFDGEIEYPKSEHPKLLGRDYFTWEANSWSDWRKLDTVVNSTSEWITVALCVKDAWEKFSIYHEFDNLRISIE